MINQRVAAACVCAGVLPRLDRRGLELISPLVTVLLCALIDWIRSCLTLQSTAAPPAATALLLTTRRSEVSQYSSPSAETAPPLNA